MSKRGIQSANSTNCIADVERSKCRYSGIVTRKPARAPISAIQRAKLASRSRPKPSTATPATIGTQIASDRYGVMRASPHARPYRSNPFLRPRRSRPRSPHRPPVEQTEHADDHDERVVIDVARLDAPDFARHESD